MQTQDFKIPLVFRINGVPRRGTKERSVLCYSMMTVTFPSVNSDEAPVACVFPTPYMSREYPSDSDRTALRVFDGELYTRLLTYGEDKRGFGPDELSRFLGNEDSGLDTVMRHALRPVLGNSDDVIKRALYPKDDDHNPIRPFNEADWKTFDDGDRVTRLAAFELEMASHLVVDGHFWSRVSEPVYSLRRTVSFSGPNEAYEEIVPLADRGGYSKEGLFSLNDWDRFVEYAQERYRKTPSADLQAEVLVPGAFRYDDSLTMVREKLQAAVSASRDRVPDFPKHAMMLWAEMRDLMNHAQQNGFPPDMVDAVLDAAEAFSTLPQAQGDCWDAIRKARKAWDGRRIDMSSIHDLPTCG